MLHRFCFPCDSTFLSCANCCIKQYVKLTKRKRKKKPKQKNPQKKDFDEIPFGNMYSDKQGRALL